MSDLLLAGSASADGIFDTGSVLADLLTVEESWSACLAFAGLSPDSAVLATGSLAELVSAADVTEVARAAEHSGNPVVPLVALLRSRLADSGRAQAARFLHRGLTSQDTLDTALVLGLRRAARRVRSELHSQAQSLRDMLLRHRDSLQTARTLGQPAVPTTFGVVAAGWLGATLDVDTALGAAIGALPVQVGGAGGTLSAVAELVVDGRDPAETAIATAADLARRLSLLAAPPWHTHRRPLTSVADALVSCTDSWSVIAGYVLTRSRPEIGELREGAPGGSSTMPHKANPVLSTLIRRAALGGPPQLALLHTAAALGEDERSAGPWHSEWPALRSIARTAVVAADQTTRLLDSLVVDVDRMRANANRFADDLLAEQRSVRGLLDEPRKGDQLTGYLGAAGRLVDAALERPLPQVLSRNAEASS